MKGDTIKFEYRGTKPINESDLIICRQKQKKKFARRQ
jgi:hypothetical protein